MRLDSVLVSPCLRAGNTGIYPAAGLGSVSLYQVRYVAIHVVRA